MTLDSFQAYLCNWIATKLNVNINKVQVAYQNVDTLPAYPYYTVYIENVDLEMEEIDNLDNTQDVVKLNTSKVCIKAYSDNSASNNNKSLKDLQILLQKMQSIDEVEIMQALDIAIKPFNKIITLKEQIQENEFIDMAMLEIIAEWQETEVRNDLGYYDTFTGTFESDLSAPDLLLPNEAMKITGYTEIVENTVVLPSESINLTGYTEIVEPQLVLPSQVVLINDSTERSPAPDYDPIIPPPEPPILQTDFDDLSFGIWLGETSMSTISSSTITGQA